MQNQVTTHIDANGVTWYSNDNIDVLVGSNYSIRNKTTNEDYKKYQDKYFMVGTFKCTPESMLCRIFGVVLGPKNLVSRTIDQNKPLSTDNVYLANIGTRIYNPQVHKTLSYILGDSAPIQNNDLYSKSTLTEYTYITEDLCKFNNELDAIEHQAKVDQGKEAAEEILSEVTRYALAEKMYLKFAPKGNYTNFVDVLNNNTGIKKVKKEKVVISLTDNIKFIDELFGKEIHTTDNSKAEQIVEKLKLLQQSILDLKELCK